MERTVSKLAITGRFTLPGETGMEPVIRQLVKDWGVDAVRDSDGTALSQEILDMGLQVYSTLCLVRHDNAWMKEHPQYRQQMYLTSDRVTATGDTVEIDLMGRYFREQLAPNTDVDIHRYWQAVDRTTGENMPDFSYADGKVTIRGTTPFHLYSVSFLAWQLWEPVSMYNHLTNDWGDREHLLPMDVRYPEAQQHTLQMLRDWLKSHPKTDVVRFTTFFYQFDLIYNEAGKERQVDWFGYLTTVSPYAMEQFEKEYGYALTPEDFIDEGRFNTPFNNPTRRQLDWMAFNQRFVSDFARQCVEVVHEYGRKAIMFLGDQWAGVEPYGPTFQNIGLDAVVGAAGDGVTTRMIADIPVPETEARFYPYFFPDIFHEGGDPVGEGDKVWRQCRRAIMRSPMQRMGYGGYLSLAWKFPEFIDRVTGYSKQFRAILEHSAGTKPYTAPFKVAVLNSWGHIRTWMTHQVAHSLWHQRCYSYLGAMEALSGLPFEVEFLSFDDLRKNGIPKDVGVILNAGDAGTSWSGGDNWADPQIQALLREWVYNGGGFIGIGEPTAYLFQGSYFQLWDVLGVQKEVGFTASINKPIPKLAEKHFITADRTGPIDYGEGMSMIYQAGPASLALDVENRSCCLNVNEYGRGRAVYMAGIPYDAQNTRILLRALYYAASKEDALCRFFAENPQCEVTAYPETKSAAVYNNSSEEQHTALWLNGKQSEITLAPLECHWLEI
ncbi:MAG: 1,3-beta-galactosyl-N-acetylhexosamine phosphorylase [Provencibacterium sp.]|nr:1,3-beta-galactosyl-N-acetylhexosamine phosphorylase [Provencibacterium sp.]